MKFELNLLQNSYDYIYNSFDLFKIADEYGMHDEQRTVFENKVKWKLAFVTLVQGFELLLKEILYRVHPNLIYENIDSENIVERNTITFQKAIIRISNFANFYIEDEDKQFLLNCSKLRNEFIHNKVNIKSEVIKSKYSKLYCLYKKVHDETLEEKITFPSGKYKASEYEIIEYDKNWTVFRGREIRKDELNDIKNEIERNKLFKFYIKRNGDKTERIKYGDEILYEEYRRRYKTDSIEYEICDDCNALIGEYHLDGCDLEICPFCFGQIITCGCVEKMI